MHLDRKEFLLTEDFDMVLDMSGDFAISDGTLVDVTAGDMSSISLSDILDLAFTDIVLVLKYARGTTIVQELGTILYSFTGRQNTENTANEIRDTLKGEIASQTEISEENLDVVVFPIDYDTIGIIISAKIGDREYPLVSVKYSFTVGTTPIIRSTYVTNF